MTVLFVDAVAETVPTSSTSVYSCPEGAKSATVIFTNCTNASAVSSSITANIVKSGGAVASSNVYLPPTTVLAGDYDPLVSLVGAVLAPGDSIEATATVALSLNLKISLKEVY